MSEPAKPENRSQHRQRVLKGAAILTGINNSAISCNVRNMHKEGAELTVALETPVPQEFLLYVPVEGIAYRCVLRWRNKNRAGVAFSGTEPKPAWHYG